MSMPDLLLCSGVDGVIYTITFNISIFVGVLSAIGLVVHEFAEGVIISKVKGSTLGLMLGFVVGVLLYVSASHLLPEAREHEKEHSTFAFLGGVGLALFLVLTKRL